MNFPEDYAAAVRRVYADFPKTMKEIDRILEAGTGKAENLAFVLNELPLSHQERHLSPEAILAALGEGRSAELRENAQRALDMSALVEKAYQLMPAAPENPGVVREAGRDCRHQSGSIGP